MSAINPANPLDNWPGQQPRLAQQLEADTSTHNIDDRIHSANLMEMDLLGRKAMNAAFGDGDALENSY